MNRIPAAIAAALLLGGACSSSDGDRDPVGPDPILDCPDTSGVASVTLGEFNTVDATPVRRIVLMGGSTEVDPASRSFVEAAGGGDVLVLRATGSTTSYNPYFLSEVDAQPAPVSVSTVRIDEPLLSAHDAVMCYVAQAEAVWLAGGDQWDYVGRWSSELHDSLSALYARGVSIGGTSAGAVVLGEAAFDASLGSVDSDEALADPLSDAVSVTLSPLAQPELAGWIVDSHFAQRDREGRLLAFLARMLPITGRDTVYGIGLDERASIIIEGDAYEVRAVTGRSVWLYRLIGPAPLVEGQPLDLEVVERIELVNGATGAWPIAFVEPDTVHVDDGVVVNGLE